LEPLSNPDWLTVFPTIDSRVLFVQAESFCGFILFQAVLNKK